MISGLHMSCLLQLQMIGFLKPTAGTAYIQGMNILTEMSRIYSCMGVCPQHEYGSLSLTLIFNLFGMIFK